MNEFSIKQTCRLLKIEEGFKNEIELTVNLSSPMDTTLLFDGVSIFSGKFNGGEESITLYIDEPLEEKTSIFTLVGVGEKRVILKPVKRFEVHLIQLSHHDPGYTNIPSHVLDESVRFLKEALDDMDKQGECAEDERYRIVVEQSYSLKRFLDTVSPYDRERMINRIKRGDIEVTALFANLISEILSPEEMLRALYPSEKIARESGVPIITAAHNDIPGFSFGYCTALCKAGIKFFVPGLPLYYSWGVEGLSSFWDAKKIFGSNRPGAFFWESAEGERILFYCNNSGCGGEKDPKLPTLFRTLDELNEEDYVHSVLRWPVQSANRDNSPYTRDFSVTVREWNKKYAYPHLICSTDSRFYHSFTENLSVELPIYRGGVDGQDYPLGSISQSDSSTVSRETHALHRQAEIMYSLASEDEELSDQTPILESAMLDMLMADEHAYGYTYPASKCQRASFWEHGVYAMRANADSHDVLAKSAASIADRIGYEKEGYRLTVFNTSGLGGTHAVRAPLRDPDNCGTEIRRSNKNGLMRMYQLSTRMQVHPQGDLLSGAFILRDAQTNEEIPFLIHKVNWDDPGELCALRDGISQGTKRMGFFEDPSGAALEMHFSLDIGPYAYKTLILEPRTVTQAVNVYDSSPDIENEYYRVSVKNGKISILDKISNEELFDPKSTHAPLSILVRNGNEKDVSSLAVESVTAKRSDVESYLILKGSGDGVYSYTIRVSLFKGVDSVSVELRLVKSEKPLQTLFMAFPFTGCGLSYQSTLHETSPAKDLLPGSHSDAIAVQDFISCEGSDILLSSASAPVVFLSHLWDGYISPAHRCIASNEYREPLTPESYDTSYVYSVLSCNNFGTNFFPAQLASPTYRFTLGKARGRDRALFGADAVSGIFTILTDRSRGNLPTSNDLITVSGGRIITLKPAEDKDGFILRLINDSDEWSEVKVSIHGKPSDIAYECDVLERNIRKCRGEKVKVAPHGLSTLRIYWGSNV